MMKNTLLLLFCIFSLFSFSNWEKIETGLDLTKLKLYQQIDDSTVALVDQHGLLKFGKIAHTNDYMEVSISWSTSATTINDTIISTFFKSDQDYYILTKNNGVSYLNHYTTTNDVVEITLPNTAITQMYFWDEKAIVTSKSSVYTSQNKGITWSAPQDILIDEINAIRFYLGGQGFIYNKHSELAFTEDYGLTWKSIIEDEYTEIDGTQQNDFLEPLLVNDKIYIVGDVFRSLVHNTVYKLDTLNKTYTPLTKNVVFNTQCFFFGEDEIYFNQSKTYGTNWYLGTTKYLNEFYYPVFKDSFDKELKPRGFVYLSPSSYTRDYKSASYIIGNSIVKYSPAVCEKLQFKSISAFSGNHFNIVFDNLTENNLQYTGNAIYNFTDEFELQKIAYEQTYMSTEGANSSVQSDYLEEFSFNPERYHVVVIDYNLGQQSCLFPIEANSLTITDLEEQRNSSSVFPNPFVNHIKIDVNDYKGASIYNLNGNLVLQTTDTDIYLGALSSGSYIIKIQTSIGITEKLIIKE